MSQHNSNTIEPNKHQPTTPTHPTDFEPSLGEKQPVAPFSLMFFTYPVLMIIAILAIAMFFRVW